MSVLEWAGLLLFAFLAVIFFAVFAPPSEPRVSVSIAGASAAFGLQGNVLGVVRAPFGGGSVGDALVASDAGVGARVAGLMSSVYPESEWSIRIYRIAEADIASARKPSRAGVVVASRTGVPVEEHQVASCDDVTVDAAAGVPSRLAALAPLAVAEVWLPSQDGVVRVVACEQFHSSLVDTPPMRGVVSS